MDERNFSLTYRHSKFSDREREISFWHWLEFYMVLKNEQPNSLFVIIMTVWPCCRYVSIIWSEWCVRLGQFGRRHQRIIFKRIIERFCHDVCWMKWTSFDETCCRLRRICLDCWRTSRFIGKRFSLFSRKVVDRSQRCRGSFYRLRCSLGMLRCYYRSFCRRFNTDITRLCTDESFVLDGDIRRTEIIPPVVIDAAEI